MSGYSSVFWLTLCACLTGLGLVLSIAVGRRRGFRSLLRGAAWSLIPIAAYMTGSTLMFWRIGDAIGKFGSSFVFSSLRWAGIAVAGLAVAAFLASGSRERRKAARAARAGRVSRKKAAGAATPAHGGGTSALPATRPAGLSGAELARTEEPAAEASKPKPSATGRRQQAGSAKGGPRADNDLAEVEEILRKRGILPPSELTSPSPAAAGSGVCEYVLVDLVDSCGQKPCVRKSSCSLTHSSADHHRITITFTKIIVLPIAL